MPDTPPPASTDLADQVAHAVADLIPALRRQARTSLLLMLGTIALTAALIVAIFSLDIDRSDRWELALFPLVGGFFAVAAIHKWTVSTREALVMPILARAVGLDYGKNARGFLAALPKRLLPAKAVRSGEDHVMGRLGAHRIQMAEVTVETGGKNSRTLLQGIVAQFPNRTAMPAFFIALADKTRPGVFFGGDLSTEGLHHLRDVSHGSRTYGIWTSQPGGAEPPALAAVIDVLTGLEAHVGPGAHLYSATSNGEEMHVALTHERNLFRVGGLFPDESQILADVQKALQDLTIPLALAQALIRAEEAAEAKVKGA